MLASMMADMGHFFCYPSLQTFHVQIETNNGLVSMRKSKGIPTIQRSRGLLLNH
jgi:hypothetical protein